MQAPKQPPFWPFEGPSVLAPMEGVSHPAFRQLMVEQGGIHLVCTEFVRITKNPVSAAQLTREVVLADGCPLSVQVMGNEVEHMADAAGIVSQAGAAVVDVNLGCPMPRVVRKGVGAAMLKDPVLLGRVLSRMRTKTVGLLSAKIRAGFDDAENVLQIAKVVEDSGVDFIAVHPRRRCDFYSGVADWRIIARLSRELKIPVVGNGDVWYAADALRMQLETGCDAVMIGRPALRNPWIFRQIAELRAGVLPYRPDGEALFSHLRHVLERYNGAFPRRKNGLVGPMKEILSWLGRAVNDGQAFQRQVLRLGNLSDILDFCARVLSPLPSSALDLDARGELQLERSGSARERIALAAPPVDALVNVSP